MRTFECNYCHAINTVPESLVEAAEHAHRGYIRWGGRVTLVPFGETTDASDPAYIASGIRCMICKGPVVADGPHDFRCPNCEAEAGR
jgi:hypothetical protein